jgi:hypothetical protein
MAQNELFDSDEMVRLTPEDLKGPLEQLTSLGQREGDRITDKVMSMANNILRRKLESMNIDVEAEAAAADYDDVADYISELDSFYEVVSDLCHSYLEGMERTFPFPILN